MTENPSASFGILSLVWKAGPVVKLVIFMLIGASVLCWGIILSKHRALKLANRENKKFLDFFWSSKSLDDIVAKSESYPYSPVASVFSSGFKELQKVSAARARGDSTQLEMDNIQRALLRASQNEVGSMERYVTWLASTASAAPFIGLFGTVWGIMNSFQQIGLMQNANIAVVAPGISEALIATAIGLAAAIPAAIFYNHFANQIRKMGIEMDCFSQDLLNIVQRGLMQGNKH